MFLNSDLLPQSKRFDEISLIQLQKNLELNKEIFAYNSVYKFYKQNANKKYKIINI